MPLAPAFQRQTLQQQSHAFTRPPTDHKPPCLPLVIATVSLTPTLIARYWLPCCTVIRPELAPTLLDTPPRRLLDMCFFVASQHSCGHLHEKFGRCFFAQRDAIHACNKPSFPIWQHSDPFPCPVCFAQRKTDTNELLSSKGGKRSDAPRVKKETVQHDRRSSTQSAGQQNVPANSDQQIIHGEYANIGDQLQNLTDNALRTSPLPQHAVSLPWIPPSQRYASIVGQLGSSPPPRSQTHEITSPLSGEMLFGKDFSRPDSAVAPAHPEQSELDSTQFAFLLRQAE